VDLSFASSAARLKYLKVKEMSIVFLEECKQKSSLSLFSFFLTEEGVILSQNEII
jgi:hypothetical protein